MSDDVVQGYTTKEVLIRLEAKMDAVLAQQNDLSSRFAQHVSDNHSEIVKRLASQNDREAGRMDMVKVVFGTSVLGILVGIGSLISMLIHVVNGG